MSEPIRRKYKYPCPWCKKTLTRSNYLRKHVWKYHEHVTPEELERFVIKTHFPDLDLDHIVQRYKDRLETVFSLLEKKILIKKYLVTIGALRSWNSDLAVRAMHSRFPGLQTAEDVRKAMEEGLVGKFRKASPEVRFQGYLNREASILEKKGQGDLVPAYRTLKTIQFVQNQMREAREKIEEEHQAGTQENE